MPLKTERIKLEVTDSKEGETRTFKIILTTPNSDFHLADLLRERGVISPLGGELKQAVKAAMQHYLSGAEALISTLAKSSTATSKAGNNTNRKGRGATRNSSASADASQLQQEGVAGTN